MKSKFNIGDKVWVVYSATKLPETGVEPPVEAVIVSDNEYYYNVTKVGDGAFVSTIERGLTFVSFDEAYRVYIALSDLIRQRKEIDQEIYDWIHPK
jgi:hypothetical protein